MDSANKKIVLQAIKAIAIASLGEGEAVIEIRNYRPDLIDPPIIRDNEFKGKRKKGKYLRDWE